MLGTNTFLQEKLLDFQARAFGISAFP